MGDRSLIGRLAGMLMLVVLVGATSASAAQPAAAQGGSVHVNPADWAYPEDSVDQRASANGCGSQGEDGTDVPDRIGDVSFTPACNWHDRCYGTKGMSQFHCDKGMLFKTLDACDAGGSRASCREVAKFYFVVVSICGNGCPWDFDSRPYDEGQAAACDRDPHRDARIHGDPHLVTFDGMAYPMMTAGEFALMRDAGGEDLLQARFHPLSDQFTVVSGIAARLGDHEVVLQLDPVDSQLAMFVDGTVIPGDFAGFDTGFVERGEEIEGVHDVVTIRGHDGFRVEALVFHNRLDVAVNVFEPMWGEVSGLLGDADGVPDNDLVDAEGRTRTAQEVYEEAFVSTWRIEPADSMFIPSERFDYHADELHAWPKEVRTIDSFSLEMLEEARVMCGGTGLDGVELDACVFDVLVSGDSGYADTAARSARRAFEVAHPGTTMPGGTAGEAPSVEPSTPLVEAIVEGRRDDARQLVHAGADVNVASRAHGATPLVAAVLLDDLELAELLIAHGAAPDRFLEGQLLSPLHIAAANGSVEMVELLLAAGVDPGIAAERGSIRHYTPLHAAVAHPEVVALLLEAGADPGRVDLGLLTPLHLAASVGAADSGALLIDAGAQVDAGIGSSVDTPLASAVLTSQVDMVELLLEAGADPDPPVSSGLSLLQLARDPEIRRLLGGP